MLNTQQSFNDYIQEISNYKACVTREANLAWGHCNFALSEPKIIKDFVMNPHMGINYLNDKIANPFNKDQKRFKLKFGGIFAHQRPYVKRLDPYKSERVGTNAKEICELADLVIINVFLDKNLHTVYSSASLLQAKKDESSIKNKTQSFLYDYDQSFEYDAASFSNKTPCGHGLRKLPSWHNGRGSALQYLLLSSKNPLKTKVRQSPWSVDHMHQFGFFLYRMLTFNAGKTFHEKLKMSGRWSSIIYDLLEMAAGSMGGKQRGSSELDVAITRVLSSTNNISSFSENIEVEHPPILFLISQDTELISVRE